MISSKSKILYIESLRGIAALSVAFYHFGINSYLTSNSFIKNSWLMVDFFFLLSGFVIALNFQNKIYNFSDSLKFQARRFFRLYPLHIAVLLVFLIIECAKYIAESRYGLVANNPAFTINNFESFLLNVFMIHALYQDYLTWNGASWSISAEFFTYFLFSLIVLICKRKTVFIVSSSVLISFAAFIFLFNTNLSAGNGLVRCFFSFFLGVIVWNLCRHAIYQVPNFISYFMVTLSILAIVFSESEDIIGINILTPFIFSLMLISLQASNQDTNYIINLLNKKKLVYLGTISYGIYMLHGIIWWVMRQILKFGFNFPVSQNKRGFTQVVVENELLATFILTMGLILIIYLSHLSYKFLEKPMNRFRGNSFKLEGEK